MGISIYANALLTGIFGVLGVLNVPIALKFKSRKVITFGTLICSVLLTVGYFYPIPDTCNPYDKYNVYNNCFYKVIVVIISSCIVKFFSLMMVALFNIYALDMYPTSISGLGMGFMRFAGLVGNSMAPVTIILFEMNR